MARLAPYTWAVPSVVDRPELLNQLLSAPEPVVILSAPKGYGKTTLLNAYQRRLQAEHQDVVSILCLTDDQRAAHLAATLVRRISRLLPGLFEGVMSDYAAFKNAAGDFLHSTPEALAESIAFDLSQAPGPLTILIDGLVGPEQIRFVLELTRRSDMRHHFVLSGHEPLAKAFRHSSLPHVALTATELAFTARECDTIGLPWGEHHGWPAAVMTLAVPGHLRLGDYLHHLLSLLGEDERAMLPAALLEVWYKNRPTPGAAALGLADGWVERLRHLGWPLLDTVIGEEVQPHPLLRDAMLVALAKWGDLESASTQLAQALSTSAPLRSLELTSSSATKLMTARQELPGWASEGQWTQIRTHLEPYLNDLDPDELAHYARACLNLASSAEDLRTLFLTLKSVLALGAQEPQISLILAEAHLRLGHADAAITVLDKAKKRLKSAEAQLALLGIQGLAQLHGGRAGEMLIEFNQYTAVQIETQQDAVVAKACAQLEIGDVTEAHRYALTALLSYLYQPIVLAEHLSAVFVLIDLLTDLGEYNRAEQLLSQLPASQADQGWFAARLAFSQGRLAFRQHNYPAAHRAYTSASALANSGGYANLSVNAEANLCLLALKTNDLPAARFHSICVRKLSRTGESSTALLRRLDLALAAYDDPSMAVMMLRQRSILAWQEAGVVAVTHLRHLAHPAVPLDAEQYGVGVWRTWLPGGGPLSVKHRLSIALLREQPNLTLNGSPLVLTPKEKAVLAYLAIKKYATLDELRRDLFDEVSSPRTYIHKTFSAIRAALIGIVGNADLGLVLMQQRKTHTYWLHERLSVTLDVHDIMYCPSDRIVWLFECPLGLAERELWFAPVLNGVRDSLARRLRTMPLTEARPILEHLCRVDHTEPRWGAMPPESSAPQPQR